MDAYLPNVGHYLTAQRLDTPGVVQSLSGDELKKLRKDATLESMIAQMPPPLTSKPIDSKVEDSSNYNPKEELRKFGWEIYEGSEKPNKRFEYRIFKSEFEASGDYPQLLKKIEGAQAILALLREISPEKDHIKSIYVTADNALALSVVSPNKSKGNSGVYIIMKTVPQDIADEVRKISPFFGQYDRDKKK